MILIAKPAKLFFKFESGLKGIYSFAGLVDYFSTNAKSNDLLLKYIFRPQFLLCKASTVIMQSNKTDFHDIKFEEISLLLNEMIVI